MTRPDQPFEAPWQAQAFAMTVALHERGVFTWLEWTETLGDALATADDRDSKAYYQCWLRALEMLLDRKLGTTGLERAALAKAWHRAAHATPHGQPIRLENARDADPPEA
ncbi:nitrile hydratase accessory protein [Roseovarius sp. D22-M7]|uniref:nitrile hydratase accessory protein n=1 Tax=Roseovarius sp. D22-M7 TaxID=3127116 RepID=UPI00300F82A9